LPCSRLFQWPSRPWDEIKATFAAGIESLLAAFDGESGGSKSRAKLIDTFARSVGAIVLSRACPDDSALADEILAVCRKEALAALTPPAAAKRSPHARRTATDGADRGP
jgi:TetR/AcrR family transcriptional repressor of nem operon